MDTADRYLVPTEREWERYTHEDLAGKRHADLLGELVAAGAELERAKKSMRRAWLEQRIAVIREKLGLR